MDDKPHIAFLFTQWPAPPPALCDAEMQALAAAGFRLTIASLTVPAVAFRSRRPASLAAEAVYPPPPALLRVLSQAPPRDGAGEALAALAGEHALRYPGAAIPPATAALAWWFSRELRSRSVQHVHVSTADALPAALYLKKTGLPFSFTAGAAAGYASPDFLREALAGAEFVIAPTRQVADELHALSPSHSGNVVVIAPGIDASRYPSALCGDAGMLRLVTTGALTSDRGLPALLTAMAGLAGEGIDIDLTMCGDGPWQVELEAQASRLLLHRHVRFAPGRDHAEIKRRLAAADLYVHLDADDSSALPSGIMEAMATGLPVLAAARPGPAELVVDEFTGWLIPPDDSGALASRLTAAAENPGQRSLMGQRGLERIQSAFSLAGHAREAAELFRRNIAGRFAPAVSSSLPGVLCLLDQWPLSPADALLAAELRFLSTQPGVTLLVGGFEGAAGTALPPENTGFLPDAALLESIWQQETALAEKAAALRSLCLEISGEEFFRQARRAVYTAVLCRTHGWVHVHALRAGTVLWAWIFRQLSGLTASAVVERHPAVPPAGLREILGGFQFGSVSDPRLGGALPDVFSPAAPSVRRRWFGLLPPVPAPAPPVPDPSGTWRQWLAQARSRPRPPGDVVPHP